MSTTLDRHNRVFSWDELETIRDLYPVCEARKIAQRIGRRNPKAIRNVAAELGVMKQPKWTASERALLRRQYGHADLAWLCRRLGRTRHAVMHMVKRLGIQRLKTWTAEDDAILRAKAPTHDAYQLAEEFQVTPGSVIGRCKRIGIRPRRRCDVHPWKKWGECGQSTPRGRQGGSDA